MSLHEGENASRKGQFTVKLKVCDYSLLMLNDNLNFRTQSYGMNSEDLYTMNKSLLWTSMKL